MCMPTAANAAHSPSFTLVVLLGNVLNYMNVSTFVQWTVQGFIIIAAVFFQAGQQERRA